VRDRLASWTDFHTENVVPAQAGTPQRFGVGCPLMEIKALLPGLTRQSILLKQTTFLMDARVKPAHDVSAWIEPAIKQPAPRGGALAGAYHRAALRADRLARTTWS